MTDANSVELVPGTIQLDLLRLEELESQGEWRRAASLVRGQLLEGFTIPEASEFEDWLTAERLACLNRSLNVLVRAADDAMSAGELGLAVEWSARALNLEPGSDAAAQTAMKSLALDGNRAAALQAFEVFASHMDGLGAEPQQDTRALAERVRQGRQWRRPAPKPAHADRDTRRAPLVGRAHELTSVVQCWDACRGERHTCAVVVEGDPGTGKTRLAEEVLERAKLDGAITVVVRAVESDSDEPWCGAIGVAEGGLLAGKGISATDPGAVAVLNSVSEQWADRFSGVKPGGTSDALGRSLRDALRAVATEQPLFIFIDDAHSLDSESLHALQSTLQKLADLPILIWLNAVTGRPRVELDEIRSRIGRGLNGVSVSASPLSLADIKALCSWMFPESPEDHLDRLARRIEVESGGLPLLAVEMLHALNAGHELTEDQASWPQPFRTLTDTLPADLPDAVVGAIRVGFRRLSADAQKVLCVAAIVGGRVSAAALERGSGVSGEALNVALDELEWDRWLAADDRGYSFVARIVRDVVLRDMVTSGQHARVTREVLKD